MNKVYCIEGDPDYGCIYIAAKNGKTAKNIGQKTWVAETIDRYIDLRVKRCWGVETKYEGELNIRQINELGLAWWCCEHCKNEEFEIIDKYTYRCMKCGKTGGIPYLP